MKPAVSANVNGALPDHASVVVIGAGVMGCSTLYHLAHAGVSDAIALERHAIGAGTTWHSAAQVRALRSSRNLTRLIRHSVDLYQSLESETGQATGWIGSGALTIATTPDRLTHIRRQEALAQLFGIESHYIGAGEAAERWPLMRSDDVLGAVWSPGDGRVSPTDVCAALAKGARARGARFFEGTGVEAIHTEGGRVVAVETTRGRVRCDAVAVCAGLWSRAVAAMGNVDAPLWPCEHFYLLTDAIDGIDGNLPTLSDHDAHLYIRDDSGGLLVGCFEPHARALDPRRIGDDFAFSLLPEDFDHFEPMMRGALHRLPCLADAGVRTLLNGPESFTPDGAFLLGESAETRGLFLGCGMNSVGIATGGGAGHALAHCIVHGATPFYLGEVDPKRFAACMSSVDALSARAPEVLGEHYAIAYPHTKWRSARNLEHTPLDALLRARGASFTQVYGVERATHFGGEELDTPTFGRPGWFEQVAGEVETAHRGAALLELSTFGKLDVRGADAESFLDRVCANDMRRAPGRVIYTALLNERGGIESDLAALRISPQHYRLYTGTGARKRDRSWLRRAIRNGEQVTVEDVTEQFGVIGLAGPEVPALLQRTGLGGALDLAWFTHGTVACDGTEVMVARLSSVGEFGLELTVPCGHALALAERLVDAGARPCGSHAQSSMRIEKRFVAFGHDVDTDVTPLEAGLDFAVDWRREFTGRAALLSQRERGVGSRLVSLLFDDVNAVPLGGEPVRHGDDHVGQVTSAAFGFRIGRPVALALVDAALARDDTRLRVDVARTLQPVRVVCSAAFDPEGARMR